MANRRQFISATALIAASGGQSMVAMTPTGTAAAATAPAARDRMSAPGPFSVPAERPDPTRWQAFKPAAFTPVVHAEFKLSPAADPIQLFVEWFNAARDAGETSPEVMTLSTMGDDGMPDSRVMRLHWVNEGRFQFSSYETSPKGKQLKRHPKAALAFYWGKTGQQVRVRGTVRPFTRAQVEDLRPIKRLSMDFRLHDLMLHQSEVLTNPEEQEAALREAQSRYQDDVPLRDWMGWFLTPLAIEFFLPVPANYYLNAERLRFSRRRASDAWKVERLVP